MLMRVHMKSIINYSTMTHQVAIVPGTSCHEYYFTIIRYRIIIFNRDVFKSTKAR